MEISLIQMKLDYPPEMKITKHQGRKI